MLPEYIAREHVLEAMARIDRSGVPPGRDGRKFALWHTGRTYPPKLIVSLAHEVARGHPWPSGAFSGGRETNSFLQRLGFEIRDLSGRLVATRAERGGRRGVSPGTRQPERGEVERLRRQLLHERPLYWWTDLEGNAELPPPVSGIYAWFFKQVPPLVPTGQYDNRDGLRLLYLGVSPVSAESGGTLRDRIKWHYRGNSEGSTLRRSLGCLLENQLGTVLRRLGSGARMGFGRREAALNEWMVANAAVTWVETDEPWRFEEALISILPLPLNIEKNTTNPFRARLKALRLAARRRAVSLPILKE